MRLVGGLQQAHSASSLIWGNTQIINVGLSSSQHQLLEQASRETDQAVHYVGDTTRQAPVCVYT